MTRFLFVVSMICAATSLVHAQKTNDEIASQIKSLKAQKTIELTYDEAGNTSKIMARAENVDAKESSRAGIQAMNFATAFFYPGKSLAAPPETINLTFWVLTKNPQFATEHNWIATIGSETLDLGEARYAAKPGESMEYLNFKIKRDDLAKIAAASNVEFKLGTAKFTFTPAQLAMFRSILAISDVH